MSTGRRIGVLERRKAPGVTRFGSRAFCEEKSSSSFIVWTLETIHLKPAIAEAPQDRAVAFCEHRHLNLGGRQTPGRKGTLFAVL